MTMSLVYLDDNGERSFTENAIVAPPEEKDPEALCWPLGQISGK